ncbi:MAG TPA: glycine oxidase ThiO [Pyrinomonadaceae bacterium]|nr:glycine oxidase ThiO [Pyrinomonadaceae bacterium]
MNSEVLIIGGGVIGLSIARALHKKGAGRITVVDRGSIGGEASWAAAGMLAPNIETDASESFHRFGIESLQLYPDFAAALLEETGIDIELDRSGTLCLAFDESEAAELLSIYERQRLSSVHVEHLAGSDIGYLEPSVSALASIALLYPNDWQVENRKLLAALMKFARINGIRILENVEVSDVSADGVRITGAKTSGGDISSEVIVIATGAWTSLIKIAGVSLPISVKPIRGQMISLHTGTRQIFHVIYSPRGYVVPRADGRVLVGATVEDAGFNKSTTPDGIKSLRHAGAEIIPSFGDLEITGEWSGLRPLAADGLPVIGDLPGYENVFVATAHYRNGILLAPKTAKIISERIAGGGASSFPESFGVGRFSSAASASVNF